MQVKRKKKSCSIINKLRIGFQRKLDARQRRAIIKESSKNPVLSAREMTVHVVLKSGTRVILQTIRNILHGAESVYSFLDRLQSRLLNL